MSHEVQLYVLVQSTGSQPHGWSACCQLEGHLVPQDVMPPGTLGVCGREQHFPEALPVWGKLEVVAVVGDSLVVEVQGNWEAGAVEVEVEEHSHL